MKENEAIEYLQSRYLVVGSPANPPKEECEKHNEVVEMAIKALEEVQKYRAIGTPEECRTAMEKQKKKNPIRLDKCTCPSCGTYNEVWKKRRNTLPSDVVHCWHCGQAVEIFREGERWED